MNAYSSILSRAQQVASQPYAPYGGQLTAGLDPTQQAGISNINAAYGQAQPWFNQAAQYGQQGAAPVANISGADIQQYYNPYQQSVIDATLGNINESDQRQQQMVKGNAAMSGALGGDRQAVAQAELARQQGLARNQTLAGLQSQGYSQALGAAQSQQANQQQNAARALQGAGVYGNLGAGAQAAQLQGAGAQLGAGQVAQQTEQQRLSALYGQFQQQQAFPYQQLGWLSGIAAPIGSQMGQTQTNTGPAKDNTSSYIGMGLSALGAIFADGGRVGFADGGSPYNFIMDSQGYIPRSPQLSARPMQIAAPPKQQEDQGMGTLGKGVNAFASGMGKSGFSGLNNLTGGATSNFGFNSSMMPDYFGSNYGSADQLFPGYGGGMASDAIGGFGFADGGLVDTVRALRKGLRSYADGGDVNELPFNDRFAGMPPEAASMPFASPVVDYNGGDWSPQEVKPQAMADWRGGTDLAMADAGGPRVSPSVELPPEITAGRSGASSPYPQASQAQGYAGSPMSPQGLMGAQPETEPKRSGLLGLLTDEQRAGLMATGAGMMAGSRNRGEGLRNLGLGIQQGMGAMAGVRKEELAKTTAKRNADAEARKLMHDLRRDTVAEQQLKQRQTLEEQKLEETKWLHRNKPITLTDKDGMPYLASPLTGERIGQPQEIPPVQAPNGPPGAPSAAKPSEEEQGIIPANARLVQGGAYNYKDDAPYIEKGMDVPDPQGVAGRSPRSLQTDAEYYLQTGKLPTVRGGKSPVAIQDTQYKRAVQNYAGALAQSRGLSPEQTSEMWRTAPGMLRFILGQDGRATVSLGTAVRHLDTLKQLADAWKEGSTIGNWQTWNRLSSSVRREFGDSAVTNLESASRIVGPEIIKALGVAGAGTEHDRSTAAGQFMTGKGFDQILGAVDTTQKLLGGQLEGKKRQAEQAGVSEARFKGLMGERAYEVLSNAEKGNKGEGGLKVGTEREGRDNKKYRFKGGDSNKKENWELVN